MAVNASSSAAASLTLSFSSPSLLPTSSFPISSPTSLKTPSDSFPCPLVATPRRIRLPSSSCLLKYKNYENVALDIHGNEEEGEEMRELMNTESLLYSFSPLPMLMVASLPGAGTVRSLFGPFVELVKSWDLPGWIVHWGHPGNMAVVLFAMGGYGTYLGFRIRYSDNAEEKANAKDLHPKLLAGMFFFFAAGATGGVTALLTSDKPIFESPHAVTGLIGLSLLTIQTILPALFEGNSGLRTVHGILGSGIMTLFLIHAALGLQLGLSY